MKAGSKTRVGGVAANIKASLTETWEVLTDASSWQAWWPDGAPRDSGAHWALGDVLVWDDPRASEYSQARITELTAPAAADTEHVVGGAKLVLTFDAAGVDVEFRVDAVQRRLTNVIVSHAGPHITDWGLKGPKEQRRLEKQFHDIASSLHDVVETYAASRGPRFHYESRELFLHHEFNVFLKQAEALRVQYEQIRYERPAEAPAPSPAPGVAGALRAFFTVEEPGQSEGSVPVELIVQFPPLCSGCLEPTHRTHETQGTISSAAPVSPTETRVRTLRVPFAVPLCDRCASYGLDGLIGVEGHTISVPVHERDIGDWVDFHFPNVAYFEHFLAANALPANRIAPGKFDAQRATSRRRDRAKLDDALAAWRTVRDGLGFHRYAQLKHRLSQLGDGDPAGVAMRVRELAGEFSVTLDQLRDVERIADEPIPALHGL